MKLYVARSKQGNLQWFKDKPVWNKRQGIWQGFRIAEIYVLDDEFDNVTFDNSPQEAELKLV
jgi:hypothetical protein